MSNWKIDRMHQQCAACDRPFEDGQVIRSVVGFVADPEGGDEVPHRLDHCPRCAPKDSADLVYWDTRWQAPEPKKKKVDFDRLLRLFEGWLERARPEDHPLLYLMGLLLVRKRFFRMLDLTSKDGQEYLRLRKPGPDGESFLVPAPLLDAAEIPVLRERLESLIDGAIEDGDVAAAAPSDEGEAEVE